MISFSKFSKRRGATLAGVFSVALCSVFLLCGAARTPTGTLLVSDVNANSYSITNAATVSASSLVASGSLTAPSSFTLPYSKVTGVPAFITSSGAPVQSVAGRTGAITLTMTDIGSTGIGFATAAAHQVNNPSGFVTLDSSGNITLPYATATIGSFAGSGAALTALPTNTALYPTLNQNTTGSAASFTGSLSGDVTGTQSGTTVGKINGTTIPASSSTALGNAVATPGGVALASVKPPGEVSLFYDDDFVGDVDGPQALCEACQLAHNGNARIVGAVCDVKTPYGVPAISFTLNYFGFGQVPLGAYQGSVSYSAGTGVGANMITSPTPNPITGVPGNNGTTYGNSSTTIYRQVLAAQPDYVSGATNFKIVVTGSASALNDFYNSAADSISPYTGAQLIARKCNPTGGVVVGGGGTGSGGPDYNFSLDPAGAQVYASIAATTPGQVVFVPYTGSAALLYNQSTSFLNLQPLSSPAWLSNQGAVNTFGTYDTVALLYAIMGGTWGGTQYFTSSTGSMAINSSNGDYTWNGSGTGENIVAFGTGGSGSVVEGICQQLISSYNGPFLLPSVPLNLSMTSSTGQMPVKFIDNASDSDYPRGVTLYAPNLPNNKEKALIVGVGTGASKSAALSFANNTGGGGTAYFGFTYNASTTSPYRIGISSSSGQTTLPGDTQGPSFSPSATQTTVSGSTSGSAIFSEPLQGSSYKKVVIYCNALSGTASYTFPKAFTNTPVVLSTSGPAASVVSSLSTTAATVTGAPTTGQLIVEGY